MNIDQAHSLESSDVFVCVPPPGRFEGSTGEEQLHYALALRKEIVVWLLEEERPVPAALNDVEHVVCRTPEEMSDWLVEHYGGDGASLHLTDGEYL